MRCCGVARFADAQRYRVGHCVHAIEDVADAGTWDIERTLG
jgi:hypothetical protein